ncbi:serine/threonine-protein kinase [Actinomadura sp. B10D3]|uniref:serine/threonine-protein kinase n=1 Tax=Actinomadura sp. B10D3 TaxID=3153557 RepID=UPI00325E4741
MDRLESEDPGQIGEFWLAGRLGAGGQGVVYDAYGPDGTRVAIKVLHGVQESPAELAQMAAEARAAQRVASFCTARIVQVRLEPPRPYIVSEYIDGLSLQASVTGTGKRPGRFRGDDLYRLGIGITTALTAIHQAKVVHRDLKPGNIMLGPDGPRLIDFGIARVLDTGTATQGSGFVGTLRYMAPEVYAGQRAGAEADVFAWGAIMVFAATGDHAFTGSDLPQIAYQIRTHDPDLTALPAPLRELVAAALAKDPLERPSARGILAALTSDPHKGGGNTPDLVDIGVAQAGPFSGWEPGDPALGKLAEDVYAALPPDEQRLVPEVFLRCVVPGEAAGLSTRPVPVAELFDRQDPVEGEALKRMVRAFEPLLTSTGEQEGGRTPEQIVLARPAVLRAWPRLRGWVEDQHQELPAYQRIRQAARVWDDNGRRRGDVLTGANLDQAVGWASAGRQPSLNRIERGLLNASTRAQTTRTRRTRAAALVLAVATLLSLTTTGWAIQAQQDAAQQRDKATRQRDTIVSSQLVTKSEQSNDPAVSALLAAAAWQIQETPESRAGLLDVLAKPERAVLHTDAETVAFSPDGRIMATASSTATVQLWDARTRKPIGEPLTVDPDARSTVSAMAFSQDGRTLATVTRNFKGTTRLWDIRTRKPTGEPLATDDVLSVAFTQDGHTLATAGTNGAQLWNTRTHQPIGEPLTTDDINSVAFTQDGHTLATAGTNGAQLWNTRTHQPTGEPLTTDDIYSVAFSPDGHTLATTSDDTMRLWDVRTRHQIGAPLPAPQRRSDTNPLAFSPHGNTLALGGYMGVLRLFDVGAHSLSGVPLSGHTDYVNSAAFSQDGRILATSSGDGTVRLWDANNRGQIGKPLTSSRDTILNGFGPVAFSPHGPILAVGGDDGTVRLWNVETRRQIGKPLNEGDIGPVLSIAFSPDGNTLAITRGRLGGVVRLWDVRTHRPISAPLTSDDTDVVNSVVFSPDGGTLAIGGGGKVQLWKVKTRRKDGAPLKGDGIGRMAFSPDGSILATGSYNEGTVQLWNVKTRRKIGTPLTGHTEPIQSVDFSPDGRTLATGSEDDTARLWDVETRRQIGTPLIPNIGNVSTVVFSPDGRTLATASEDGSTDSPKGTVWLWDVEPPTDLVGAVCAVAGRPMTPQEWRQHVPTGIQFQKVCP